MFERTLDLEHAFDRMSVMSRTRVRRRRRGLLAAGIAVSIAWAGPVASALGGPARPEPMVQRRYVVRPGDTLWSIARRVAPWEDPRAVVVSLVASNGVQADELAPGRTLVIPSSD